MLEIDGFWIRTIGDLGKDINLPKKKKVRISNSAYESYTYSDYLSSLYYTFHHYIHFIRFLMTVGLYPQYLTTYLSHCDLLFKNQLIKLRRKLEGKLTLLQSSSAEQKDRITMACHHQDRIPSQHCGVISGRK